MKEKSAHLIIIIFILLVAVLAVSYSYFSPNVISNDIKDTKVTTGKIDLKIDDDSISAEDIAPIYDEDYEMLAFKKNFLVISSESNLNSCAKIYLNIDNISDSLKSEYFKYKISSNMIEEEGNFKNAVSGGRILLADKVFVEANKSISFDLYIWISYQDNIDQLNMLGTNLVANLVIEGVDVKTEGECIN